jgi:hypothetical protein
MKRVRGVRALVAAVAVLSLGACRDSGLPDRNLPLQEARHREFRYPAYQPTAGNTPVALAGRQWMRQLPLETIAQDMMVPVGDADGTMLYAVRGARAPYSRLYAPVGEDRWAPYLRLN